MTTVHIVKHTASVWQTRNLILANGQFGMETDTKRMKVGNGADAWNLLGYFHSDEFPVEDLDANYVLDRKLILPAQRTYRYALANRHFAPVRSLFFGDSIFEGQGASVPTNRFMERWVSAMRARRPTNGSSVGGRGYLSVFSNTATPDSNWEFNTSLSGTVANGSQAAAPGPLKGHSALFSTAATMTFNVVGTSIDVYWFRNTSAGSFTVTVDGGAPSAAVSTAGTSGPNFRTQAFSLGASGAHTVVLTASVASTRIEGIFVYDGDETTGIHIYDDSRSQDGSASRISSGVVSTSTISVWNLVSPDVIFCNLITNDYLSNIDPETTNTNLRLYLAAWKALTKVPSVVFFVAPLPSTTGRTYDYQRYVDILNDLADENLTMVSVYDARNMVPQATTSGLLLHSTDGTHLNNRGQAFVADDFALFTS